MPFTASEVSDAGKIGLDFYMKNNPIDQVAVERPFLKMLMDGKKNAPGAKQYIVEQLRYRYQSNFQWFNGAQVVTYNRRQSIEQTQFPWRSAHDGVALDEDRLIQNGISVSDSGPGGNATKAEMIQLTNLLDEQMEILRLGFEEQFSTYSMLDGTDSADALEGLDKLISLSSPASGTVGGINKATNGWWRNHAATGLDSTSGTGDILTKMEIAWRACVKNGGRPTDIFVGSTFLDGYRDFLINTYGVLNYQASSERVSEGGTKELLFHGIPMQWVPEWDDLDATDAPSVSWKKRCYMLNKKHMKLRPMEGQHMITRKPPRPYDRYEYYWALTWRGALTTNRLNAMAAVSVT